MKPMKQLGLRAAFAAAAKGGGTKRPESPAPHQSSPGSHIRAGRADSPANKKKKGGPPPVSYPVPAPTVNVVRTLEDLTPEGGIEWGEDGLYADRRPGMRTEKGFLRFTVINRRIFPRLTATTLPAPSDRVEGGLYPTHCGLRFGKWSAKGRKLHLQCPWCVSYNNGVNQANYPHEEGGSENSLCVGCRDAAGFEKVLGHPCQHCGETNAAYPLVLGGKGQHLCMGCADKVGSYEPQQKDRCPNHPHKFKHYCTICCPADKLSNRFCIVCKEVFVGSEPYAAGRRTCAAHTDRGGKPPQGKVHENAVADFLLANGFAEFKGPADALPTHMHFVRDYRINFNCAEANSTSQKTGNPALFAKIDFVINVGGVYIFIECDEKQHRFGYGGTLSCDFKRMCDVAATILLGSDARMQQPYWLRFNPNAWHAGGVTKRVPTEVRQRFLLDVITSAQPCDLVRIGYLFYDCDGAGALKVLQQKEYDESFRQRAVCLTDPEKF